MTTAALTAAQQTNLDLLAAVGGTYTFTQTSGRAAPRRDMRYRFEMKRGYRATYSEKASHKGFHRAALQSLRDMGLVTSTVHTVTEGTEGKIGYRESTVYTYTLAAAPAPEAPAADELTAADYFRMSGKELRELGTEGAQAEIARRAAKRAAKKAARKAA